MKVACATASVMAVASAGRKSAGFTHCRCEGGT